MVPTPLLLIILPSHQMGPSYPNKYRRIFDEIQDIPHLQY